MKKDIKMQNVVETQNVASLQKGLTNKFVQCLACQRYCQIAPNQVGFCQTRLNGVIENYTINKDGVLYALTYGILNGIQIDPIEKKPLYHFHPGTQVLSFGSYGCNYRCKQCLNWHCSWGEPASTILKKLKNGEFSIFNFQFSNKIVPPKKIVDLAIENNCPGIAFTYNEPSIWPEYVYDAAKLAKEKGLYTVFVSNGSWSKECLKYLAPVIDAVNIDIKGFYPKTYEKMGAFFGEILKITELVIKKYKIHTELTTLVIPTINDSEKELTNIANWIYQKLGCQIPWHLSRFEPGLSADKEFNNLPDTPITTLKKAYEIGKKAGLQNVYVWAPAKNFNEGLFSIGDTYCPKCKKLIIKRLGWQPKLIGVKAIDSGGQCSFCQEKLYIKC